MKYLRRALGALLIAPILLCLGHAHATSFSTDQSDIWNEIGAPWWAASLVQRGSAIVAVIYVYNQSGAPVWYSATLEWAGFNDTKWSGYLYETQGPFFGTTPFDSSHVSLRKVGGMLWTPSPADQTKTTGTLVYDVDGVLVTKHLQRYLARYDDFSGNYQGGMHLVSICTNPSSPPVNEFPASFNVTQNGIAISVQETDSSGSCLYSGQLSQAGQMGSVQGSFLCGDGRAGTFLLSELTVNIFGISGAIFENFSNPAGCTAGGWLGGARKRAF